MRYILIVAALSTSLAGHAVTLPAKALDCERSVVNAEPGRFFSSEVERQIQFFNEGDLPLVVRVYPRPELRVPSEGYERHPFAGYSKILRIGTHADGSVAYLDVEIDCRRKAVEFKFWAGWQSHKFDRGDLVSGASQAD